MNGWLDALARHGAAYLFCICFLEAIGFPIPAAIALLTAGALSAAGKMSILGSLAAAGAAFLIADCLLFIAGRRTGWWLLSLLCRVSTNPEACILSAAQSFYRRGRAALLFAKFLPGVNTMAAPLAGSMHMPFREFLISDFGGVLFYGAGYFALGYVFSDVIGAIIGALENAGRAAEIVLVTGLLAFIAYRVWLIWKNRRYRAVPRVDVQDVDGHVIDVRSHGYYDPGAQRIQGSVRLEPNILAETIPTLPESERIYLYCT